MPTCMCGITEKGSINTPLELAILNQVDRFNLAIDVIDRVPGLRGPGAHVRDWLKDQSASLTAHFRQAREFLFNLPLQAFHVESGLVQNGNRQPALLLEQSQQAVLDVDLLVAVADGFGLCSAQRFLNLLSEAIDVQQFPH